MNEAIRLVSFSSVDVSASCSFSGVTFTLPRDPAAKTLQKHVGRFLIQRRHCADISLLLVLKKKSGLVYHYALLHRLAILTEPAERAHSWKCSGKTLRVRNKNMSDWKTRLNKRILFDCSLPLN